MFSHDDIIEMPCDVTSSPLRTAPMLAREYATFMAQPASFSASQLTAQSKRCRYRAARRMFTSLFDTSAFLFLRPAHSVTPRTVMRRHDTHILHAIRLQTAMLTFLCRCSPEAERCRHFFSFARLPAAMLYLSRERDEPPQSASPALASKADVLKGYRRQRLYLLHRASPASVICTKHCDVARAMTCLCCHAVGDAQKKGLHMMPPPAAPFVSRFCAVILPRHAATALPRPAQHAMSPSHGATSRERHRLFTFTP
jgi:hypothetical protein